ncbi:MAG: 16S rRNA (guanine(527)-N(7))-methyltransferase RsmG [Pseudomonadota bacterium]|nr:MAG: 16S rRNA (guanine(527)-N(7))-methyltransferase RsmG [Pseudomonadota bacterium]
MTPQAVLADGAARLGLALSAAQCETLLRYIELLEKWNGVYNLTAVRGRAAMVRQHLLDSLAVVPHIPGGRLLDVGTGPGLPGIPIAVAQPERPVSLVDSSEKKTVFARQAAAALGLENVSVHSQRVERWQPEERFDLIISRAFADIAQFVSWCAHLLAPEGVLAAMKGAYPEAELQALPEGYAVRRIVRLEVPYLEAERHLVLIGKL